MRGVMARLRCSQQMSGVILTLIMRDPCTFCGAQSKLSCRCSCDQFWASNARQITPPT